MASNYYQDGKYRVKCSLPRKPNISCGTTDTKEQADLLVQVIDEALIPRCREAKSRIRLVLFYQWIDDARIGLGLEQVNRNR